MRIVAGKLKGRYFNSPKGHRTHPMSEKMRGAIFSTLGDVEDLTVLDAFAGSGAISLEAISRGAKSAIAIDIDKNAHETLRQTAKELTIGNKIKVTKANIYSWSTSNGDIVFDLVFCDPPYDKFDIKKIFSLAKHVKKHGLLVLSSPPGNDEVTSDNLELVQSKDYGDSAVYFYRKIKD